MGQEGEVLEVHGGEALVALGALKIRRPLGDLLPLRGAPRSVALARAPSERLRAAEGSRPAPLSAGERRLDARGLRVEELLRDTDGFLDRLFTEGATDASILHGHGTGALKQALREHLARSPYVASFRPGEAHEGGDAITVVKLRS
jgi:DNA mismatch repair protein MutS2